MFIGLSVAWLALLVLWCLLTAQTLADGLRRPYGGERRPRVSRATNQPPPFTTGLTRQVAGYTRSPSKHGRRSAVRAIPRTLDALSRRIGPGSSTTAMEAHGVSGAHAVTAGLHDPAGDRSW